MTKIVLAGLSSVGKTSLCHAICAHRFSRTTTPTVGVGNFVTSRTYHGERIPLHIWDTAGAEVYLSLLPMYFRNAQVILLVYSLADLASFASLDSWLGQAREEAAAAVVVVGNKSDLGHVVPHADGRDYARRIGALGHFRVSALTGEGIEELMDIVVDAIARAPPPANAAIGEAVDLASREAKEEAGCCR
jgi:small GTP-binding protein